MTPPPLVHSHWILTYPLRLSTNSSKGRVCHQLTQSVAIQLPSQNRTPRSRSTRRRLPELLRTPLGWCPFGFRSQGKEIKRKGKFRAAFHQPTRARERSQYCLAGNGKSASACARAPTPTRPNGRTVIAAPRLTGLPPPTRASRPSSPHSHSSLPPVLLPLPHRELH